MRSFGDNMSGETSEKPYYIGLVIGYRRGLNTQYENQVLLRIDGISDRSSASRLIGWKALFVDSKGNKFYGKIIGVHGNKGVVIGVFKPNLPGQAIGKNIYVYPRNVKIVLE